MAFRSEKELEQAAIPFLENFLIHYAWQVPLYNRVIDLVGINKTNQLIGIEFKLKNWKRALEQASRNANALDFVYVCLPDGGFKEKLISAAREKGIGVLIYDFNKCEVTIALRAKKILRQWPPNVMFLRNIVNTRRSA